MADAPGPSGSALRRGSRVSRYEVLELLGRGGMGEVWRARDAKLGREVALKVLHDDGSGGPEGYRALEQEARAASALSSPHLVTVFDVDTEARPPLLAMELVDGPTLASLLAGGPIPPALALDLAAQVADGLAAAHEAGLVHRDVKPSNVIVARGGIAKILDFGLVRRTAPVTASPGDATLPLPAPTSPGTLVGTVGYMSPEQAAAAPLDFRSDQFSLGVLLLEMLTGRAPFLRKTTVETIGAILREEPPPPPPLPPAVAVPLGWVLHRCLAKQPEGRYSATRDLARDLREIATLAASHAGEDEPPSGHDTAPRGARRAGRAVGAAALALVAAALGAWGALALRRADLPVFHQLTFRRGTVWSARFSPGAAGAVYYSASWDGDPVRVFSAREEGGPSSPVGSRDASLLAVSGRELLLALDARERLAGVARGTLARMPLAGGDPREVLEGVEFADLPRDAAEPVVVRRRDGKSRLEILGGHVLFETSGWVSHPRASPDGTLIAFLHHPTEPDDRGDVLVVPVGGGGARTLASGWSSAVGLAWGPGGSEVWFTATGATGGRALHAVDRRGGTPRTVFRMPGNLTLHDVSPAGRALLSHDSVRVGVSRGEEGSGEGDESWLDSSLLTDVSPDGRLLLFTEFGEGGGPHYAAFLRRANRGPATRLGEGMATALSPDARKVLTIVPSEPPALTVLPVGPGKAVRVPMSPVIVPAWATWFPDGRSILLVGSEPGHGNRLWRVDGSGAPARPLSPEGISARFSGGAVSSDGATVAAATDDGRLLLSPSDGGEFRILADAPPEVVPIGWHADGTLLGFDRKGSSARLLRLDAATGAATPLRELRPSDTAGVIGIPTVRTTPDARVWVYSCARLLSELYVVDGLR